MASICVGTTALAAVAAVLPTSIATHSHLLDDLLLALLIGGGVGVGGLLVAVTRLLQPLHDLRRGMSLVIAGQFDHAGPAEPPSRELSELAKTFDRMVEQLRAAKLAQEQANQVLAARTATVDRLLDFSQTIQGAGKPLHVLESLVHFLRTELALTGVVVMSLDPESAVPQAEVRAAWPTAMVAAGGRGDVDATDCPCLRQNQPKLFAGATTPVRCAIDRILTPAGGFQVAEHPAYCVPFAIRKTHFVVHMLLGIGRTWDADAKQLAQAYVNSAHSTLMSLHLLAEAERQSMTDGLTGLYNRRSMEPLLEREVALAERHDHPLSLVMLDMDKFKTINDQHGHAAGDHLLRTFADCVRMTLRKTDLAFRYGGDEFCIALPQTTVEMAQQVVAKLRQAFMAVDFSDAIAHLTVQPTLSIGVVQRSKTNNVLTLPQLMAAADAALYDAKAANRNCVRVYSPPKAA